MPKLKPETILPTEEEDKAITKAAIVEDTHYTDEELEQFKPFEDPDLSDEFKNAVRKGRPPQAAHKIPVSAKPQVQYNLTMSTKHLGGQFVLELNGLATTRFDQKPILKTVSLHTCIANN